MRTWFVIGLMVFLLTSQLIALVPQTMGEDEGQITDFDVQVEHDRTIRAYVEIQNTGGNKQDFSLKFSIRDENGRWWEADGIGTRDILPGQKHEVSALVWNIPEEAIAGWYLARIDLQGESYGNRYLIDYQEIPNAFRIIRGGEISDIVIENQEYTIDSNVRKLQALYSIPVSVQVRNTGNMDDIFYLIVIAKDQTGEPYSSRVEELSVPIDKWDEDSRSVQIQIPLYSDAGEGYYSIKVELYGDSRGDDRSGLYNFLDERDLSQAFRVLKRQSSEIGDYSTAFDGDRRLHFISSISVPNAQLSALISKPDGQKETLTTVADASGKFDVVLEPKLYGIWKIRVSYGGDDYFSAAERSFELEVAEDAGNPDEEILPPEEVLPSGTRVLTGQPPPTKDVHNIVFTDSGSQTKYFPTPSDSLIGIWITVTTYVQEPVLYFDFAGTTYSADVIPNSNTFLSFSRAMDITDVRISIKDRGYSDDAANIAYAYQGKVSPSDSGIGNPVNPVTGPKVALIIGTGEYFIIAAVVVVAPLTILLARRRTKDKRVAQVEPTLVEPIEPKDPLAEDLEKKKDVLDMLGKELGLTLEPAPTLEELLNKYRQIRK